MEGVFFWKKKRKKRNKKKKKKKKKIDIWINIRVLSCMRWASCKDCPFYGCDLES